MDHLTPPLLTAIREIRWQLLAGHSLKDSLVFYLNQHHDELAVRLNELWSLRVQGQVIADTVHFTSPYAQALWDLIERGHQGQPILEHLLLLEDDAEKAAAFDLDLHVATLPFKALVPLLFFQFPAFLILLMGPMLRELGRNTLFIICLLCFVFSAGSFAESLNEIAIRKISGATRAQEVTEAQRSYEKIRVARLACQIQLQEKGIPYACYQALRLEIPWNLHSDKSKLKAVLLRLDGHCHQAALSLRGVAGVHSQFLSDSCARDVKRARELVAYKSQNWPEN